MSEIEALLGLYGAIDRAVVAGDIDPARISPLLGAYREDFEGGPATGWYDNQYLPWVERVLAGMRERGEPVDESEPEPEPDRRPAALPLQRLDPSLLRTRPIDLHGRDEEFIGRPLRDRLRDDLAQGDVPQRTVPDDDLGTATDLSPAEQVRLALEEFEEIPADEGRIVARRLLAVTVAARGLPQFFGSDGSHADVARAALTFTRLDVPGYAGELTRQLHAEFTNEFTSMGRWTEVIQGLIDKNVLPQTMSAQKSCPPCVGELVWDPPLKDGKVDPKAAIAITSYFRTDAADKIKFKDAICYLAPENWKFPGSIWKRMDRDTSYHDNSWLYHECVSAAVAGKTWTVSTDLRFKFSWHSKYEARVMYDFPPGWPHKGSDILVDGGSLAITDKRDGTILVYTTKRVKFAGSFDGPGLVMFMCATGYSTVLHDLVLKIARSAASATANAPVKFPVPNPY